MRNPDGVSVATDAIFKDGGGDLGVFASFFNISAYMAARALKLMSTPMFLIVRIPANMILGNHIGSININAIILHRKGKKIAKNSSKMTFLVIILLLKSFPN